MERMLAILLEKSITQCARSAGAGQISARVGAGRMQAACPPLSGRRLQAAEAFYPAPNGIQAPNFRLTLRGAALGFDMMKHYNFRGPSAGAKGRAEVIVRNGFALVLAFAVLGAGGFCRAQEAEAQKLLAAANVKETQAQKLRADAALKKQEAANDEGLASANQREASILTARAMQMMKADANKQRAFQLRSQARELWANAHSKAVEARNDEQKGIQCRHNAEELLHAGNQVKDQAAIAETLRNDAKAQAARATELIQSSTNDKAAVEMLNQRAETCWAEAEKLDPDTTRALAPKPAKPELRPAASH